MPSKTLTNYEHGIYARNAVWGSFFLMGITGMAWIPRIPEIKSALGLSDGQFGLLLLASTFGAVPGAQLSGRIVHMFSSKIVVRIAGVTLPLGVSIMGIAKNVPTLALGLFFCGFSVAFMDVALNSQAIAIEQHTQGRWMSTFHGLWSIGAFCAALVGGLVANLVSPQVNLLVMSSLSFLSYLYVTRFLLPPDLDGHAGEEGTQTSSKVSFKGKEAMILWGIGFGLICALVPEGGAYDWSGILLRDHMNIGKGINAAAATIFSLTMIASRLLGDKFFEMWGHVKTVKYGALFGGGIWGLSILVGVPLAHSHHMLSLVIVCIGFGAAGFGIGPFFPAFNLAAASIPGVAPSVGLARIGLIAIASYFAGPTLIGGISQLTSLPIAFAFPVLLMMGAALQTRFIKVNALSTEK
jgi:MFS family permease